MQQKYRAKLKRRLQATPNRMDAENNATMAPEHGKFMMYLISRVVHCSLKS